MAEPNWFDPCEKVPPLTPEQLADLERTVKEGRFFGVSMLDVSVLDKLENTDG